MAHLSLHGHNIQKFEVRTSLSFYPVTRQHYTEWTFRLYKQYLLQIKPWSHKKWTISNVNALSFWHMTFYFISQQVATLCSHLESLLFQLVWNYEYLSINLSGSEKSSWHSKSVTSVWRSPVYPIQKYNKQRVSRSYSR